MDEKILFVDDDPNILEAYQRKLRHVLKVFVAEGPLAGLKTIREKGPFAVVMADMNMPQMNGVEFLQIVHDEFPDTVRMMLTGQSDIRVAMDAVNNGNVFRFLTKPCPSRVMGDALLAGIKQYRLVTAERELLDGTLKGIAELLTEVLSWVNPDIFGRSLQLRNTAKSIAMKLQVPNVWEIEVAATLHQIGLLAIPSEIPMKLDADELLTEEEQQSLRSIPGIGHELLERIPRLDTVADIILYQDKHMDGSGFPDEPVPAEDIPLGSRILKVAKDFHALRSMSISRHDCLAEMSNRKGWYDPSVINAISSLPHLTADPGRAQKVVPVSLKDLREGYTLAAPILTADERKLVGSGIVITQALLIRLRRYAETNPVLEPLDVLLPTDTGDKQ